MHGVIQAVYEQSSRNLPCTFSASNCWFVFMLLAEKLLERLFVKLACAPISRKTQSIHSSTVADKFKDWTGKCEKKYWKIWDTEIKGTAGLLTNKCSTKPSPWLSAMAFSSDCAFFKHHPSPISWTNCDSNICYSAAKAPQQGLWYLIA